MFWARKMHFLGPLLRVQKNFVKTGQNAPSREPRPERGWGGSLVPPPSPLPDGLFFSITPISWRFLRCQIRPRGWAVWPPAPPGPPPARDPRPPGALGFSPGLRGAPGCAGTLGSPLPSPPPPAGAPRDGPGELFPALVTRGGGVGVHGWGGGSRDAEGGAGCGGAAGVGLPGSAPPPPPPLSAGPRRQRRERDGSGSGTGPRSGAAPQPPAPGRAAPPPSPPPARGLPQRRYWGSRLPPRRVPAVSRRAPPPPRTGTAGVSPLSPVQVPAV